MFLHDEVLMISVITICKNEAAHIAQTIESVIGQSYSDVEYIVIDGGSTDGTVDIIKSYSDKISYFVSEPDNGIYDALNKGILAAHGEIIGTMNGGDFYEPGALQTVWNSYLENPDSNILYGNLNFIYDDGTSENFIAGDDLSRLPYGSINLGHVACFVTADTYIEQGLYNTAYKIAGDYDFLLRCYVNGKKFYHIRNTLSNYRVNGVSSTNHVLTFQETCAIALVYASDEAMRSEIREGIANLYKERFLS